MTEKPRKTAVKSSRRKGRKTGPKKLAPGERATVARALVGTVTAAELTELWGVTDQTLRNFAAQGMPKASRGRYPLRDACRWYLDTLRKRDAGRELAGPTKADVDRDMALLKLKRAQGEVFDRREVMETATGAHLRLGNDLEQLATRIGREMNMTGADVKMIRDMVDEMRARYASDMAEFIDVVEQPDAAPATQAA